MFTSTGIVLKSFDYKDKSRIISLFTKEEGLISLIVKKISLKNLHLLSLTTPFCEGEFLYVKKQSDLHLFQEGSLIDIHDKLRSRFASLQAAAEISQMILHSQMPGQMAPFLYALTRAYLLQIPCFEDPGVLIASFQLKLLKHEGIMPSSKLEGFTQEEWECLLKLASAREFSSLKEIVVDKVLNEKLSAYVKTKLGK